MGTELANDWSSKLGGRLSSVVIAGGKVFVAQIDAHTVHALDAATGKPAWSYVTGGRVDSPPTFHDGRVLFGSADGCVYCLRASDGALIWRFQAAPQDRRLMAFEQLGCASRALEITREFVMGRYAFGRPIASFQAIKHKCADMMVEVECARSAAYYAACVVAEESGNREGSEYTWVIDPLDGTTNFLHGFPMFAVSVGVMRGQVLEHGVVYDPLRDEMFTASRGEGAQLNGKRIRVSTTRQLAPALLGTGFPFRDLEIIEPWMRSFQSLLPKTAGIRRAGAAGAITSKGSSRRCRP